MTLGLGDIAGTQGTAINDPSLRDPAANAEKFPKGHRALKP